MKQGNWSSISGSSQSYQPKQNRVTAWEYDRAMYKRRNEIERLFRRLRGFRRIFSRFYKLDIMFVASIQLRAHRRGAALG
jgi:transposase